jgi:hypothetical protein
LECLIACGPNPGKVSQALKTLGGVAEGEPGGGDRLIEGVGVRIDPIAQVGLSHFSPEHFGGIQFR